MEVVDTHDVHDSDLLGEPRLQVDEAQRGDGSGDQSDEQSAPGSDLEERRTNGDGSAQHGIGEDQTVDLSLYRGADEVRRDDGSDTGHVAGDGSIRDLVCWQERGDEGRPEHPQKHAGEPHEVGGAHVNEDRSSGVGRETAEDLHVREQPLYKGVYYTESDPHEQVLPHFACS